MKIDSFSKHGKVNISLKISRLIDFCLNEFIVLLNFIQELKTYMTYMFKKKLTKSCYL
jgi:hypothetical protein